jgi:GNAT superfamily N-acetyltransferase
VSVRIRLARPDDLDAISAIERAATQLFVGVSDAVAADEPMPPEEVRSYIEGGRAWVAVTDDDVPVGHAFAKVVDGEGYLHQVDVVPTHGRQGIGRALVEHVCAWAAGRGLPAVTLTTFRDVPWNGPFYARLGFEELPDPELGPQLAAVRAAERAQGLDDLPRIAMRRGLLD